MNRSRLAWLVLAALLALPLGLRAAEQSGQVSLAGLPVPGATVTAVQGDKKLVTSTDIRGEFKFADLAEGNWTIRVEMVGFSPVVQEIVTAAAAPPARFELKLMPIEEIAGLTKAPPAPPAASPAPGGSASAPAQAGNQNGAGTGRGNAAPAPFQRAAVNASNTPNTNPPPAANPASPDPSSADGSNPALTGDGLLVNGSVNNGSASPFAQLAAFGNNRRGGRSLYNWGVGAVLGNSALDARPFSFTGDAAPRPSYSDTQLLGTFGGPIKIPGVTNRANLFLGYQRTADHNATTQSGVVPTPRERNGDFSQTLDAFGRPVSIVNPLTGIPFSGNVIPPQSISSQAAALLNLYPTPNLDAGGRYNYQTPVLVTTRQDAVQVRITQSLNQKNQVFGNVNYQLTRTDTGNLFGFSDASRVANLNAAANWSHRFSPFLSMRFRYEFTRISTDVTPYFSDSQNISGAAGITGNNQDPVNWGPPSLVFSSGVAGLASMQYASNHDLTHAWTAETIWSHGRHSFTIGGDVRRRHLDIFSQQNARGTFSFTGASGSDVADFLLGLPHTSSIAFGNPDKFFRAMNYDAYVTDDWRVNPTLTANLGVRWEYESPMVEREGRLVNLDIAPGFTAISPVYATDPSGSLTGQRYPDSLLRPDRLGIEPRVALAWRPVAGSSLVVRAGYGVYRNANVYQTLDTLLAQQPPLSTTQSLESTPANLLTLAKGFPTIPGATTNTFAVNPDFRVGVAQNWQLSVQRDLPASLTMIATYLGTHGTHLMQEFLPNTYPIGAANPCPTCPAGFIYLASDGTSTKHAGQIQFRRRLRNGFTATVQYTLAKATDNAAALSAASLNGSAIAQDWLNLEGERAPSNFDQRHQVTAQLQYTTGMGIGGGAMLAGWKGNLIKGWTITSQLTVGSGLPLTPVYLTSVPGTGVTGSIRPNYTGVSTEGESGSYANPAAFAAPTAGSWGSAGRNSLRGPSQFVLNGGLGRTFLLGDRLNLDWRLDATNVLNRVTYSTVNTVIGSPQFGLPTQANTMRKIQSTVRLRF